MNITKISNDNDEIKVNNVEKQVVNNVEKQVKILEEQNVIIKYKSRNHNKILKKYKNDKFNIFDD